MGSILTTIKKLLGIAEEYTHFDTDIIIHINSVFFILQQLGVGPTTGFSIEDDTTLWTDYLSIDDPNLEGVKTYVYMKVRLLFDPPTSSSLLQAMENSIREFEWRLNHAAETNS